MYLAHLKQVDIFEHGAALDRPHPTRTAQAT